VANRKQRRRREKEKRHDYDLVEIDSEGNETVLSAAQVKPRTTGGNRSTSSKASQPKAGRGRGPVPEPSWGRVLKRAALFSPIFFATVLLLNGSKGYGVALVNTVLLLAVFVPFSYLMDRFMWRSQQKRLAKPRDP
jgi:hypothetical protein